MEEPGQLLLALCLLVPFSGALLALFVPVGWKNEVGLVISLLLLGIIFGLTAGVMGGGTVHLQLGGWEPPLGIGLRADGLAMVFLLFGALVGVPVGIYAAWWYSRKDEGKRATELFWPLWLFLWGAMNGLFLSVDLFNWYVLLEVLGLAAVGLAVLSGQTKALIAGLRYLLAALVGSMAYLMGVALLYASYGVLDAGLLGEAMRGGGTDQVAFALMMVGLLIKTALLPFHFWLPGAHSAATPPVSAILSALVVKASFYLILRLWVDVFGETVTYAAGQMIGWLGAVAIVWGSYQALRQDRLKRMVAHSTVSQIGYLFLLFPLLTAPGAEAWSAQAWTGGVFQVLAHGLAKAALFLAVGIIVLAMGNDRKDSLLNMVGRMPMTTFALALAGVSLIGLPPSGGFIAKWMFLEASLASGQWWWAPMMVGGSLLTAGYIFMVLRIAFAPAPKKKKLRRVPPALELTALGLAVMALLIGVWAEEVLPLLDVGMTGEFEPIIGKGGGGH
ncbi:MAG: hypothetical protein LAT55_11025 [Opitutales bacterium]|nr:hypothetical protein [Opitutales bacterium]